MSTETLEKINRLGDPLPSDAIQRTKNAKTYKGYDTDGYGYQFCVNRLNEIFGDQWGFSWDIVHEEKGAAKSGKVNYEITVKVNIWVLNPDQPRSCVGNHISLTHGDALKGAITNGFKKTAAFWGVGKQAYEGALDNDNDPWPEWAAENGQDIEQPPAPGPAPRAQQPPTAAGQQPQQPPAATRQQPQAGQANGNGHNGNGHDAAPPVGNGTEAGMRRKIEARLKPIFGGDQKQIQLWLVSQGVQNLQQLGAQQLGALLVAVDKKFEEFKSKN